MKMIYSDRMTNQVGYQMTEKDIETAMSYLLLNNLPSSREDAIKYLEEKTAVAHMAAHKIVEDEQSGVIEPVKI